MKTPRSISTAIGIEISEDRLVLARMKRRATPQTLYAGPLHCAQATKALDDARMDMEKGRAFAAVSAPANLTLIRHLEAPFASLRKAEKIWPALLDVTLPFPVENACCLFTQMHLEKKHAVTLAAAIRESDLQATLAKVQEAGLDPTHCQAEALALWAGHIAEKPAIRETTPTLLVWIGEAYTLCLRGIGNRLTAAHVLRHPQPLKPDHEESRKAFIGLFTNRFPDILNEHRKITEESTFNVWWCGPGAEHPAGLQALQSPAVAGGIVLRHGVHQAMGSFLARALARSALAADDTNFRTGALLHPLCRKLQNRAASRICSRVMAASVLLIAINGFWHQRLNAQAERLQSDLFEAARTIVGPSLQRGQELLMVERTITRRDEETAPFRRSMDTAGMEGRIGILLEALLAQNIEVSQLRVAPGALSMEGHAPRIEAVEAFKHSLENQDWTVQLDSPGKSPEGRTLFLLKGSRI